MTDEQKIKIIDAIVTNWYELGCERNDAAGTLYAIGSILAIDIEMPKKEYTGIFDEFFKGFMPPKDNGDKGNV